MNNDSTPRPSRRDVLKATGAAAAAGVIGAGSVSAQPSGSGQSELPDGTRVFIGENTGFGGSQPSSASVEQAGLEEASLGDSDMVIVSPKTDVSRRSLTKSLRKGKPVVTVGRRAFDGLLSVVYDTPTESVREAVQAGRPKEGHDLPYSFGFEYSETSSSNIAMLVPANGTLSSVRLRRPSSTFDTVVEGLGNRLISSEKSDVDAEAVTGSSTKLVPTAGICPPGTGSTEDGWNCLGVDELDVTDPCPYGGWDRRTYGAKLNENDSNNDWWAWETQLEIRPSGNEDSDCSSSAWYNDQMGRSVVFNDGICDDYGPEASELGFGKSKSVGFDLSAGFKSVTGTAGVSFSQSETKTGVEVDAFSGNDDKQVEYDFPIERGGNIAGAEFIAYLGQRQKTENNLSSTDYSYDDYWRWYDPNGIPFVSPNTHEETEYGTGYWSV
jgi:hypothetical protein